MSRAFVRESDEAFDGLPERPVSPHPNLVTPKGLGMIEAVLARLHQEHALAQLTADRAALVRLSRELRYWTARRKSAQVVAVPINPSHVQFGCTVMIVRDDGRKQRYRIVGEDEADPAHGTISYVSPLARALMGKKIGDVVQMGDSTVELAALV
jgi:transcription elongation GreA/GreB family factor